jgi:serine phosphatase RsbU (regulator of sigma subunit)
MTLPAEIQWSLLPLATFASDDIELSGALEPAYDVGGDAFDYACGSDVATIGLFDAMGHGLASARLSSLAIAAFRTRGAAGMTSRPKPGSCTRRSPRASRRRGS